MAKTGQSKGKKKKAPKPVSVSKAKARAWKAFSDYIKVRDALKTTGTLAHCICITCGKRLPIAYQSDSPYIQSGHAIDGRGKNILFDEDLVNGQCSTCNCVFNGRLPEYASIMINRFGMAWWADKVFLARKPAEKPWRSADLLEIEETYKRKYAEIIDTES